jgi:hypothetical protein
VTLRVGIVASSEHAQIQIEARDVTRGDLIAMTAWPHVDLWALDTRLPDALAELLELVAGFSGPF